MTDIDIQREIEDIRARNERVELDKAWETSLSRRWAIAVLTYFVVVSFFFSSGLPGPFVNAIVPTLGFMLSTLSLPLLKRIWIDRVRAGK